MSGNLKLIKLNRNFNLILKVTQKLKLIKLFYLIKKNQILKVQKIIDFKYFYCEIEF
jgi:hypothetical protein